jgi:hypothetical protein
VAALIGGGYGRVVVLVPLALALTIADLAALTVATLQLRADRHERRPTHTLVWLTLVLTLPWLLYALYVGILYLLIQVFCINQLCRSLL